MGFGYEYDDESGGGWFGWELKGLKMGHESGLVVDMRYMNSNDNG